MSKRNDHGGITFQAGKGFKKCVGRYQHADGRKLPKIHWLGHDAEHARFVVFGIQKVWRRISLGGGGWTAQDLADVKAFIASSDAILRDPTDQIAAERKRLDAWEHDLREIAAITLRAAAVALDGCRRQSGSCAAEDAETAADLVGRDLLQMSGVSDEALPRLLRKLALAPTTTSNCRDYLSRRIARLAAPEVPN